MARKTKKADIHIRIPPDLRGLIETSANRNERSLQAETVFWLKEHARKIERQKS